MKNKNLKQLIVCSLLIAVAVSVCACGQRVPIKTPEGHVKDSSSY